MLPDLVTKLPSKGRTLLQALWTLLVCFVSQSVTSSFWLSEKKSLTFCIFLADSFMKLSLLLINHLEKAMLPGQQKNPSGNSRVIYMNLIIGMSSCISLALAWWFHSEAPPEHHKTRWGGNQWFNLWAVFGWECHPQRFREEAQKLNVFFWGMPVAIGSIGS